MLALALETSARPGSVAVGRAAAGGGLQVLTRHLDADAGHARDLLPAAAELLAELGAHAREVTDVVVDLGPGSYTGLRVGVASALGLAVGPRPPRLVGVSAPEALFAAALRPGEAGTWLVDGRSKAWYLARAERAADADPADPTAGLILTRAPEVLAEEDLPALVAGLDAAEHLITDTTSATRLTDLAPGVAVLAARPPSTDPVDPGVLLRLGLARLASSAEGGGPVAPGDLHPLYLRPFAAKVRKR